MRKAVDITGQKFNRLTALRETSKKYFWLFQCDCGKTTEANKHSVKRGEIASCGCYAKEGRQERIKKLQQAKIIDITGKRFGKLKVLGMSEKRTKFGQIGWRCLCDCGNKKTTSKTALLNGSCKSCGCLKRQLRKGGKKNTLFGYVMTQAPDDHPFATRKGKTSKIRYIFEHRLNMEKRIGRYLMPNEMVHHKNGIRDDNRDENLELCLKRQPPGQRAEDLVLFAREILKTYGDLFPE